MLVGMGRELVTTLRGTLDQADERFWSGQLGLARTLYITLQEQAQERADRPMEVIARSMLARYHVRRRELELAEEALAAAERVVDASHADSYGRFRSVVARLAVARGAFADGGDELRSYLAWAEEHRAGVAMVDAALLLAHHCAPEDVSGWLERAIDYALANELPRHLPEAYTLLAVQHDRAERFEDALEAYEHALRWQLTVGTPRQILAATWAVGASAARCGEWALARERLEEAVNGADGRDDCADYLVLALADLAQVANAAGDPIEARRLTTRALMLGEQQGFPTFWPDRWRSLQRIANSLG